MFPGTDAKAILVYGSVPDIDTVVPRLLPRLTDAEPLTARGGAAALKRGQKLRRGKAVT